MNCKKGAASLIDQIMVTIELIDPIDYSRPMAIYNGSTLGKHFRHIFDFFDCLVQQAANPVVDYCLRERDEKIEIDKFYGIEIFKKLKKAIENLDESQLITVHADFEIEPGQRPIVKTSIGREIMYAYDHAVHHLAIVKIGLKELHPNIVIDQNLGVAASTIRHQYANG